MIKGPCHSMYKAPLPSPNVSHPPTKFCGYRHCGSRDIMALVCHMILEDHLINALKSAIAIFSKAHGMSYSHIQNFTKTFARVSSNSSLILVTLPAYKMMKHTQEKLFQVHPKTATGSKKREKKAIAKLFALHANAKISFRNKQYSPYYVKVPRKLISWPSRKNKMPNYTIYLLVPALIETATESLSRLVMYLFI